jgi:hypothetical protein
MDVRDDTLRLRIDDSNARYPVRIDPFIQQGGKLTASGEIGNGFFGFPVALSSDGNTALIGGSADNKAVGAAWVFTRSGSTWTQQAKLTGTGEIGEGRFGQSVALSSDGNTALIGGGADNKAVGAAWVFTRSGSTWSQQGEKLTGTGEIGEEPLSGGGFGYSVALSSDGNTALIGGRHDNKNVGAAWVFTRSGSTWTQQGAKLTATGEIGAGGFGESVRLSADGNTALIGGEHDNTNVGAAWVFTRSGTTWTQQGEKLTGSGEVGEGRFGRSVALGAEGNTALIGAEHDNTGVGAAWVFTRSGSTWTQQGAKLTGGGEIGAGGFGESVALSTDGNTALIGGPFDNTNVGAAWAFTRSGTTWTQQGEKLTGAGEVGEARFGHSAALSSDGNTALIGGQADDANVGATWVFTRSGTTWTQQGAKLTGAEEIGEARFGAGVALSSDGNTALIGGFADAGVGAAWTFTRSGTTWTQQCGKLTGADASGNAQFGKSVALSSLGTTALISGGGDNAGLGAAWVFVNAEPPEPGPPAVRCVRPNRGLETGGTSATITGINLTGATAVKFGSTNATSFKVESATTITAVAPAGTGTVDVTVTTKEGTSAASSADRFTFLPPPPGVVTEPASSITETSATLEATVNPKGTTVSDCHFEWGTTTSYGSSVACSALPGSGTSPVAVSASITGLSVTTTYHFRISATNAGGTSMGSDQAFTTTIPHLYKNGAIMAEGKPLRWIGWGTLKLSNATLGEVECHYVMAGFAENPTGGGAPVGKVQGLDPYECVLSASCKASGGTAIGVTPETLPWSLEVTEPQPGVFRMRSGNSSKAAGAVFVSVNCVGVKNVQFFGEYAPKVLNNGISIGTGPNEEEFDQPGSGELQSEGLGGLKFSGKVKIEGYAAQELIAVKHP